MPATRVAALSVELPAQSGEIQLFPAGEFRARDGRPEDVPCWVMDEAAATALVAQTAARQTPISIDYEHASLTAAKTGAIAPASGWFSTLEWRPGDGLYAVGVDWTERAATMIAAREYRFISPVFAYDKDGRPTCLISAALTNNPALDGMDDVRLAALSVLAGASSSIQENSMEELLEQLRWLLNLPVGATAEDVKAQLQKLIGQLSEGKGVAAASVDLPALLAERDSRIAALSATQMDPARFVPVETMNAMHTQIAELSSRLSGNEINDLVVAALSDGRLLPAQEAWARSLGAADVVKLREYLVAAPRIAALSSSQTGGRVPGGVKDTSTLDDDTARVTAMFGNDVADVKKQMEA